MNRLPIEVRLRLLKDATHALAHGLLGGYEAAGSLLEPTRGKSVVGRWANRHDAEHFIGVLDVTTLEAAAGRAPITELLCKLNGGLFVPHIDLAADEGSVGWLVMRLSKELGDVSGEIAASLADGKLDPGEAVRAIAQLDDLDTVSRQLRGLLTRIAAGGGAVRAAATPERDDAA